MYPYMNIAQGKPYKEGLMEMNLSIILLRELI